VSLFFLTTENTCDRRVTATSNNENIAGKKNRRHYFEPIDLKTAPLLQAEI
jgi:hypothetical protein